MFRVFLLNLQFNYPDNTRFELLSNYTIFAIMANQELSEQEIVRRKSMQALRDRGIAPYPAAEYTVTGHSAEIKENFKDDEESRREVTVAGRIMSRRIMGKASFMELQDADGRIQVYVSRDDLCPGEDKDM